MLKDDNKRKIQHRILKYIQYAFHPNRNTHNGINFIYIHTNMYKSMLLLVLWLKKRCWGNRKRAKEIVKKTKI